MDLPPVGHTPAKPDVDKDVLARSIFVTRGILLRAKIQLENTAKPWPPNVRRARKLVAQVSGILTDAWEVFDDETKVQAIRTQIPSPDKVVRHSSGRTDVVNRQYELFQGTDFADGGSAESGPTRA